MTSAKLLTLRILRWIVTFVFMSVGVMKLLGLDEMIAIFVHFQLPLWFMYLTGVVEVSGAIGLLFWNKPAGFLAATGLSVTMILGSVFHLIYDPLPQAIPAISLAVLCAFFTALQRRQLKLKKEGGV